jgi:very-short-patch-repair endonuclease
MRKDARLKAARRFRKNLTEPELWLWLRLKSRSDGGPVFRNQHPIGPYVLDFYCAQAKLCIEVDGADHTREARISRDAARDAWLAEMGIYTYRITAGDVFGDPDDAANGVVLVALERIAELTSGV